MEEEEEKNPVEEPRKRFETRHLLLGSVCLILMISNSYLQHQKNKSDLKVVQQEEEIFTLRQALKELKGEEPEISADPEATSDPLPNPPADPR